jgi:hypothetical protein
VLKTPEDVARETFLPPCVSVAKKRILHTGRIGTVWMHGYSDLSPSKVLLRDTHLVKRWNRTTPKAPKLLRWRGVFCFPRTPLCPLPCSLHYHVFKEKSIAVGTLTNSAAAPLTTRGVTDINKYLLPREIFVHVPVKTRPWISGNYPRSEEVNAQQHSAFDSLLLVSP